MITARFRPEKQKAREVVPGLRYITLSGPCDYAGLTFCACSPFGPLVTSNVTF